MKDENEEEKDNDEEERGDCREVLATAGGFSPSSFSGPPSPHPEHPTVQSLTTTDYSSGGGSIKVELGVKMCSLRQSITKPEKLWLGNPRKWKKDNILF